MRWTIDLALTAERKERVFRHRCPKYGLLILSDSQCGIYQLSLFDVGEFEDGEAIGCPWCGDLPPDMA